MQRASRIIQAVLAEDEGGEHEQLEVAPEGEMTLAADEATTASARNGRKRSPKHTGSVKMSYHSGSASPKSRHTLRKIDCRQPERIRRRQYLTMSD